MKILTHMNAINYREQVSTEDTLHFIAYTGEPTVIVNPDSDTFWKVLDSQRFVTLRRFHTASGAHYPLPFKDGKFVNGGSDRQSIIDGIYELYGMKWNIA